MRINRFLAACGLGSRRASEGIINDGRVEVNGKICLKLSTQIAETDRVRVDGKVVSPKRQTTILLNKPAGYICTRVDTHDRDTIFDLLPEHLQSLHHVGRLDMESEGLIVLTNDGGLSQELTHPKHQIEKEYLVTIDHTFDLAEHKPTLLRGIETTEGLARAIVVRQLSPRQIALVLNQGLKRQIRLMLGELGFKVKRLVRVRIGAQTIETVKPGKWRILNDEGIRSLRHVGKLSID